jgi:uroporphyrin-III C-methyltransferase/precorrin-2 dehydrogenase/sirohydrochlorin ferrochelatase
MRFLPVFLDLRGRKVILAGAGEPAHAKLRLLHSAGATLTWFPLGGDADVEMDAVRRGASDIEVVVGEPQDGDLTGAALIVIAAEDTRADRIAARARALNILVNVVDRPDLSTFIFPAVVDRGEVVVAIGTGGASPVLARRLRERIEALLPARIGEFADLMRRYRDRVAAVKRAGFSRRTFWEAIVDGPIGTTFLSGRKFDAEQALNRAVEAAHAARSVQKGVVHLVGAGPGDPDLLTLRALRALQAADIVFHDDLIGPDILNLARRDAVRVFVGKRKSHPGIGQDAINRQMAEAAKAGKIVVRLKGGDPFIFGRGGEELEFLRDAGVETHVVPGITAALGCAAEAGLPLTYRGEATRLCLVTANLADGSEAVDWSLLGDKQTAVAVYMGLSSAARVRDGLIAAGRAADTPAAIIARGTRPDSRSVAGRLRDLPALAVQAGEGPALLVIGDAVARSDIWRRAAQAYEAAA